jgi:hypothetical protein
VVCFRGTDTGLAFTGEAEWIIAALMHLGIPDDQASALVSYASGCDPGKVPVDDVTMLFRVCNDCATKPAGGLNVGLVSDGELPHYGQSCRVSD